MNLEVAKKRYKEVFLPDVIDNSQGDFLAKHVPMRTLYYTDHAELTEQDKKHPVSEDGLFETIFSEKNDDQFILVKGASGAGKSHLIRWISTMLEISKEDDEIVIPIRRADNTLKGTIIQLINHPVVENMLNTELYKKMASASTTIPEIELKNTIYYSFVNLIDSDDGSAGTGEGRIISNVDRRHLVALLQNASFKERLLKESGPIDRIYMKIAENKTLEVNDKVAKYEEEDFEIDSAFRTELISNGADEKARKIADKLLDNNEFVLKITSYVNKFRERVIQRCTGLEPGDLSQVIDAVRHELFNRGCSLTILIEDITAASGVDNSLLDALLRNRKGYSDKELCRITAIVGVADGYYTDSIRSNTKGRIKQFVNVPDDMYDGDYEGLVEFFARYLNTVSLETDVINDWIGAHAEKDAYPIHQVTIGEGWDEYEIGDRTINLFPFTKNAIRFLYQRQSVTQRNPRALMRNIIEPYVKDAIEDLQNYPKRRNTLEGYDPKLQNAIYRRPDLSDEIKIRLVQFMYIWGNGTDEIYNENGKKYIAGLPENIYKELGLPLIDGKIIEKPKSIDIEQVALKENDLKTTKKNSEVQSVENEKVAMALKEVDKWIENKDYKLSIGATTKSVRPLNDVRKNINDYLYEVIDWTSEGVSSDAVSKRRDTKNKFLVSFERQTMQSDSAIELSASIESRKIIEGFLRWEEIGKKSWDFPGSTDYLYRIQCWTEKIKPKIVEAILYYEGKKIEYFTFAAAAEYYRLILNGYCRNFQKAQNLSPEILLRKNEPTFIENGHVKTWNDLKKMISGSEGNENRMTVLQYYNLPQGNVKYSTNYEYDFVSFNKAVKKVINNGLVYNEEQLQLDDPFRKRRISSEFLKKILERIDTVVADEKQLLAEKVTIIAKFIDLDDIEDEDDIKEIITYIKKFYNQAQKSHISAAIHMDNGLINSCNNNASNILSSLNVALQVEQISEPVEALLRLSKDPIKGLSDFARLLETVGNDIMQTTSEVEIRMKESIGNSDVDVEYDEYSEPKELLNECKIIIEEVKNQYVD